MDYLTDRAACLGIAKLCRDPATRFVGHWKDGQPSKWQPHTVSRPVGSGGVFTDDEAWDFIAHQIENYAAIRVVELRTPPGATGYQIVVNVGQGMPDIYIKVVVTGVGKVIGRSFHYSNEK